MPWLTKLLVIANQTADSDELRDELARRAEAGPIEVTIVAPGTWEAGDALAGHGAARRRVQRAAERLREVGIKARTHVGDSDPIIALDEVWDPRRFDEIIVCTLPGGSSRWLRYDLPHRVERYTGATVTHLVGHPAAVPV